MFADKFPAALLFVGGGTCFCVYFHPEEDEDEDEECPVPNDDGQALGWEINFYARYLFCSTGPAAIMGN